MGNEGRTGTRRVDADGVVEVRTAPRSRVELASALVLVLAAAGIAWLALRPADRGPSAAPGAPAAAASPLAAGGIPGATVAAGTRPAQAAPASAPRASAGAARVAAGAAHASDDAPADLGGPGSEEDEEPPTTEDAPVWEHAPPGQEQTGLAAFPPLGTKPIVSGILVPDGFQLPAGYVRHYQATDDGQMLPPVLLFHPDHAPRDADGRPLLGTKDRVVPPEQAPPGLPIEYLAPAPAPAGQRP